ncbi:N-acetyl-alpha-D-glucosaminyl L-malate synthase BshA [Oceanithermus sp.]
MRIGLLAFGGLGGSGTVAAELGLRLAQAGHEVVFLSRKRPLRLKHTAPVHFERIDAPTYPVLPGPLYSLAAASALRRAAREHRLEVVHTHYAVPHAASASLARLETEVRVVHTLHGTDVNLLGLDPALREVTALALAQARVTAVSASLARQAGVAFGVEAEVVPNFVDAARFRPRPELKPRYVEAGEAMIVHASNFRPIKRTPDLVRAFAHLLSMGVRARLVFLGDGPERPLAARTARELGVRDRVRFLPPTPQPELVIGAADLLWLHSQEESFGLAALEALASGVPVVAARVGGLSEVVRHGETGWLVELGDVHGQAEASAALLAEPDRLEAMRRQARADARARFDPDAVVARYLEVYQS